MLKRPDPSRLDELTTRWGFRIDPAEVDEYLALSDAVLSVLDTLEAAAPAPVENIEATRDAGRPPEAGEDPLYIARRLVRFASEDVGNADPQALTVAVAAKDAAHFIGMPEGNTALAQAAIYLATAPKSNAVYTAYNAAAADAHTQAAEPVPLHLRNAPTKLMKQLDYGKGYEYAHDEPGAVTGMECLPPSLADRTYYRPTDRGFEKEIKRRLDLWEQVKRGRRSTGRGGSG